MNREIKVYLHSTNVYGITSDVFRISIEETMELLED